MKEKVAVSKSEVKVRKVLLITSAEERAESLSNAAARKIKRLALKAAHDMGHTHLKEHDVLMDSAKNRPGDSPDILKLGMSHIGLPAFTAAKQQPLPMQVS